MTVKYKGKIRATHNLFEALLALPEGVKIGFELEPDNERGITSFIIESDQEVEGLTSPVREGQSIPEVVPAFSQTLLVSRMKEYIKQYEEEQQHEVRT